MNALTELLSEYGDDILEALGETGYMLVVSLLAAVVIGLPLGMVVFLTQRGGIAENRPIWSVANMYINIVRSFPFLLLVVFLIPFTRLTVGTSFGTQAATLPLCFVAVAIYARLVEQILREIPPGVSRVALAMGATLPRAVFRVLLPEARPGLIAGATVTVVALVGFTAMGGAIGSGGLGDLAFRDGYQRSHTDVALVTVVALLVLVQLLQMLGDRLVAHYTRK